MRTKIVEYEARGGIPSLREAAYAVYNQQIVWTCLGPTGYGASIVGTIARTEDFDPRSRQFFELRTRLGCRSYQPGDYAFSEVHLEYGDGEYPSDVAGLQEGHADPRILQDFAEYIWGDRPGPPACNRAVVEGRIPLLEPSGTNGTDNVEERIRCIYSWVRCARRS
jgi:hypothetical protein